MDWIWIAIGIILSLAGIIGSVIPILPGPPLNLLALLLLHLTNIHKFSSGFITGWIIITIIVLVLDYMIPIWGAKFSGGSRKGIWGATIGLIIGIFFFPPLGMIIGPYIGAVIGEILSGKEINSALKAGGGTFIGFLAGAVAKFLVSIVMTVLFIAAII
ncbi:MAG TPA: DUF456 domain-containing protein [Lentimicrobium sp.]|nr:DUF456 domain-containing protein [Lentimicrobium sp.]